MKIAIVVHGRFHAFDLARALTGRGHNVTLFTNYPRWAVARFGLAADQVKSFWAHGVLARAAWSAHQRFQLAYPEPALHQLFGRWAARALARQQWDVVHSWSGVSEEILRAPSLTSSHRMVLRGSAHIRTQRRLLDQEQARVGVPLEKPSDWMIAREEREYHLADSIRVVSSFARRTFLEEGVAADKVKLLISGSNLQAFRPAPAIIEARCERILSGAPLCVLHVGSFSFQKGMYDMETVVRACADRGFKFRFVGPLIPEAAPLARSLSVCAEFVPKQPQARLPDHYAWGDLYLSPTIQDGFQSVVGQALAAGLPIITTPNGAGIDINQDIQRGWIVPIRDPQAIVERLEWCNTHRRALAEMVNLSYYDFHPRDWTDAAADFERICCEGKRASRASANHARA